MYSIWVHNERRAGKQFRKGRKLGPKAKKTESFGFLGAQNK